MRGLIDGSVKVDDHFNGVIESMYKKDNWVSDVGAGIADWGHMWADGWDNFKAWNVPFTDYEMGDWTGGFAGWLAAAGEALYDTINAMVYTGQTGLTSLVGLAATPFTDESLDDLATWASRRNEVSKMMLHGETTLSEQWDKETEGTYLEAIPRPIWFLAELVPQIIIDPFVTVGRGIKAANAGRTWYGYLKNANVEKTVAQAIKGWKSEGLEAGLIYWKAQALAQKLRGELATTFAERAALTFSSPNKLLKGKSIASWLVGIVRDSPDGLTAFRAAGAKFKFLTKKNGGSLVGMEKIFDVLKPLADEGYSAARLEALTTELLVGLTAGVRPGQGFTAIQEILTDLTAAKMAHVPGVLEDAGVADPAAIERIRGFADNLFQKGRGGTTIERALYDVIDMMPPSVGRFDIDEALNEAG